VATRLRVDIISVFPDYLAPLRLSLVGKAIDAGLIDLQVHDLRDFTHDRHRTVDDTPFGGGPGMVMKPEPWGEALDTVLASGSDQITPTLVVPTPSGALFNQARAASLANEQWLIFACGRYEGIDSRVVAHYSTRIPVLELSIGDFVLAGGEAAVLVMVEAAARLKPGVLGNVRSAADDSFSPTKDGAALEGPVFTKPALWRELAVPEVLQSGNHGAIKAWHLEQSALRTSQQRPELAD